jgi:hypothetical protein
MTMKQTPTPISHRRQARVIAVPGVILIALGFTGCTAISKARAAVHTIEGNKATIDAFTNTMESSEASSFEATYETTGSAPATIVYAVTPPKGLAFKETSSDSGSGSNLDIIVNPSGEYSCSASAGAGSPPSCQKLGTADAATQNQIFSFYTPAHWVGLLRDLSLAAGVAGDKVTSSTMTVNGFAMKCVDFQATGVAGTSTICTTAQNILGYVKVASDSTSFEIKDYSASPSAGLFELPTGATVTPVNTGSS